MSEGLIKIRDICDQMALEQAGRSPRVFANRLPRFNPFIPATSIGSSGQTRSCPNERGMLTFPSNS